VTGHVRTPKYVRGAVGRIVEFLGSYRNPERLAYGESDAEPLALYRVEFRLDHLFPNYSGHHDDVLTVDIYENWLEEASRQ